MTRFWAPCLRVAARLPLRHCGGTLAPAWGSTPYMCLSEAAPVLPLVTGSHNFRIDILQMIPNIIHTSFRCRGLAPEIDQ